MPSQAPSYIDWRPSEWKVQMLRNLGIRWQILSALALPVLVLGLICSQVTYRALLDMRDANQSRQLAQAGGQFAVLINGLTAERALSQDALRGVPGSRARLKAGRASVDRELATLRAQVYGGRSGNAAVRQVLVSLANAHSQIPDLRADVDSGKVGSRAISARYSQVISADVNLPFELADSIGQHDQATNFRGAGQLGVALEALAEEQLTGFGAIAARQVTTSDQRDLAASEATVQGALNDYLRTAPQAEAGKLSSALAAPSAGAAKLTAARLAFERARASRRPGVTAATWTAVTQAEIKAVRKVYDQVAVDGVSLATADYDAARKKLELTLGGGLGVTLFTLLLALGLSRRVTAPLRRLTLAATQIRDELPRLVENLQSDEDLQLNLPSVSTVGRNEVSQLAAAFVDVNAVTVEVARKQARLRSAVADMFVNVARRNQVLLARQLAFIDQLERNEAKPEALEELFRLDHLATRMRRNAESLLVLAGIESGRRLREPMPISDVVRTATSEIEHYSRVSLSLAVDPLIYAHLALPVAHLLAELLENATNFSDPSSRVIVMASPTEHGVRMTVTDEGLGIALSDLEEINNRIQEPPSAEDLSTERLGFYVVGRLAQRLDAKVTLTPGQPGGTAVLIDLPTSLFIPGAIDNPGYSQSAAPGQSQPLVPAPGPAVIPAQPSSPPVQTPQPVAVGIGAPFVAAYPVAGASPVPPAIPMPIPMPTAALPPLAIDTAALVAEAEPTWTPQPDAGAASSSSTTGVQQPGIQQPGVQQPGVIGLPLARRTAGGTTSSDPVSEPETEARPAQTPEGAAPVAGPALFSGFRSRAVVEADQALPVADEWYEAPQESSSSADRWDAWAEVSAANAISVEKTTLGTSTGHPSDAIQPAEYTQVTKLAEYLPEPFEPGQPIAADRSAVEPVAVVPVAVVPEPEPVEPEPVEPEQVADQLGSQPQPQPEPQAEPEPQPEPELEARPEPAPPVDDLRMRTLTSAIEILPHRNSLLTALRRKPKGDTAGLAEGHGRTEVDPATEATGDSVNETPSPEPSSSQSPAEPSGEASSRHWASPSGSDERRQHPRSSGDESSDDQRASLASEALSELSRLSAYNPTSISTDKAPALRRRQPSEPVSEPPPIGPESSVPMARPRNRSASSVRSMLAGFKAGVERGRTSPAAHRHVADKRNAPPKPSAKDE